MQLLLSKEGVAEVVASDWQLLADDAKAPKDARVAISYSRYLSQRETWGAQKDIWTLNVEPADELAEVPPEILALPEILISFPVFTDGRGYSHATTLRQHHGYQGRLIAVGDVRRDQLEFMRETGFTAFQITGNDSVEEMVASLGELQMPAHRLYSGAGL